MKIDKVLEIICEDLNIKKPEVKLADPNKLDTPTTVGYVYYEPETGDACVYLKSMEFTPDLCFFLAHELRHIWQGTYHKDKYLANHKHSSEIGVEAYNLQPEELDANAYALIFAEDYMGISPLFEGYSDAVYDKIIERANEIDEERE